MSELVETLPQRPSGGKHVLVSGAHPVAAPVRSHLGTKDSNIAHRLPSNSASPGPVAHHGKAHAILELRQQVLRCRKCPGIGRARLNVVFGTGNINAELMIVGEEPTLADERRGVPFSGKDGLFLIEALKALGMPPELVYLTTVLKCRSARAKHSASTNGEFVYELYRQCAPYLHRQIEIIKPKVILALGPAALEGMFGVRAVHISKARGQWFEWNGVPVMATYAPEHVANSHSAVVRKHFASDLFKVLERLGHSLPRQHRAYVKKCLLDGPGCSCVSARGA